MAPCRRLLARMNSISKQSALTTLRVVGSSSSGNGYILSHNGEHLLLECGVSMERYLPALDYSLSCIHGCLVSHRHLDHAEYIPAMQKFFIDVYSCKDVCDNFEGVQLLEVGKKTKIGHFVVQPIPLPHSVENYGYLIVCPDGHRIVFATDCSAFTPKISNVHTWLIEANYDEDIILDRLMADQQIRSRYNAHLEIKQTIEALTTNHCPAMNNVVLLHLSDGNSHAEKFRRRVAESILCPNVVVADAGMIIDLLKEEF